jgi:hypothetical protein
MLYSSVFDHGASMDWSRIWDSLNNASAAALIGSVAGCLGAVAAVFVTDRIRARRRARSLLPALLRRQRRLAAGRRAAEEQALRDIRIVANSNPPFSIDALTRLVESVADRLNDRQQQGLDNITHLMRESEGLADMAQTIFQQSERSSPASPIPMVVSSLQRTHADAINVLTRLEKIIDGYLAGKLNQFGSLDELPESKR